MGFRWKLAGMFAAAVLAMEAGASDSILAAAPPDPDRQAFVDAVRTARHAKPVIAVLALNEGTETTDFLVPYAVLRRADVATVEAVARRRGRVSLMPALEIDLEQDLASFDSRHPDGADYVIVPAMHADDDPVILDWIRAQAGKGAVIVAVCSGALVVGKAGLLDGRRFAGHWYDRGDLRRRHPTGTYVPDRRYIADRGVVTTTGVTASLPVSVTLVEAIAGPARAAELARALGLPSWSPGHDSAAFRLSAGSLSTLAWNAALFWRHETIAIPVRDGVDDIALALAADAWSRTYRSRALAVAASGEPVRLRSGLLLVPAPAAHAGGAYRIPLPSGAEPARQLAHTLCDIRRRYGAATRDLVTLIVEYEAADDCQPATVSQRKPR